MMFTCGFGRRNLPGSTAKPPSRWRLRKFRVSQARKSVAAIKPVDAFKRHITFNLPLSFPDESSGDRVYALPPDLTLEPQAEYKISGWLQDQKKTISIFAFTFHTSSDGRPAAY